jgi:hypothetical protein
MTSTGKRRNTTNLGWVIPASTHLWLVVRMQHGTSNPTVARRARTLGRGAALEGALTTALSAAGNATITPAMPSDTSNAAWIFAELA